MLNTPTQEYANSAVFHRWPSAGLWALGGLACPTLCLRASLGALAVLIALTHPLVGGAEPLATGRALHERLEQRVGLSWREKSLREGLYQFAQTRGIGALLDRRVDPGQPIDLNVSGMSVREVLSRIAATAGIRGTWIGPLAFFGPSVEVAQLEVLLPRIHDDVRALPAPVARRLIARRATKWPRFTTPRELIEKLAAEGRFQVEGLQQVPHDLLAQAALPPMPLCDRLAVVLAQFGLTFEATSDGRTLKLKPIPDDLPVDEHLPGAVASTDGAASSDGGALSDGGASPDGAAGVDPELIRIDRMAIDQVPVGVVLRQIAAQTGLQLQVDEAAIDRAGLSMETFVGVKAENVTLDELLQRVVAGTGLSCRREGRTVIVAPAP